MSAHGDRTDGNRSPSAALEAQTLSIDEIVRLVRDGHIRVQQFQRGLRWDQDDIQRLFDSIYRGYPIGTLLFWKRPAEAATFHVGPVRIAAPQRHDALWVMDGLQRIAALAGVLAGSYDHPTGDFCLFFDLDTESFVRASKQQPPRATWLPLDQVADAQDLLAWLHQNRDQLAGEHASAAIRLGKRVREYQVPAYTIESDDKELLRAIFERIHTAGKPLQPNDVFDALYWSTERRPASLGDIADDLRELEFGVIDEKLILQVVLAILDKDIGQDFRRQLRSDANAQHALAEAAPALRQAVIFLQTQASIPHLELLPYRSVLVVLARFFFLYPQPRKRSLMLLARWVWRGSIHGRHPGSTTATRKLLRAIGSSETDAVQALLGQAGEPLAQPIPLTPFHLRHASSKLQALALWALRPRHLATGMPLALTELMDSSSPAQRIVRASSGDEDAASGLANIVLHPPVGGGIRQLVLDQTDAEILQSHAISTLAYQHLANNDVAGFLTERERTLRAHVDWFLNSRAQWQAPDRPSIAALIVED